MLTLSVWSVDQKIKYYWYIANPTRNSFWRQQKDCNLPASIPFNEEFQQWSIEHTPAPDSSSTRTNFPDSPTTGKAFCVGASASYLACSKLLLQFRSDLVTRWVPSHQCRKKQCKRFCEGYVMDNTHTIKTFTNSAGDLEIVFKVDLELQRIPA